MSGKWHLGISGNHHGAPDFRWSPTAHGYDSYLGSPYTNAPMCAMDGDGRSDKYPTGPTFCFMVANRTVVQMPLVLENFTSTITRHAVDFIRNADASRPWYFFMSCLATAPHMATALPTLSPYGRRPW